MYEIKRKQRNKQTKKNNSHGYYRTTAYPTFSGAKSNYPPGKSPMSSFTSSIVVYLKFGPTRKYTSLPLNIVSKSRSTIPNLPSRLFTFGKSNSRFMEI